MISFKSNETLKKINMSQLINLKVRVRKTQQGWLVERKVLWQWKPLISKENNPWSAMYFQTDEEAIEKTRQVFAWELFKSIWR